MKDALEYVMSVDYALVYQTSDHSNIFQYSQVVLFIILYKTFKSVHETLVGDHSGESYWAVLSCDSVYYAKTEKQRSLWLVKNLSFIIPVNP